MPNVLIVTEAGDVHAYAVAEALRRKGATATLWHTGDFPTRAGESVLFRDRALNIRLTEPMVSLPASQIDTVWRRRPSYILKPEQIHPADLKFVDIECNFFRRSLFEVLSPDAFWVNPVSASPRADSKILQHKIALEVGLAVPDTLYSNDPVEIRSFMGQHGGRIVYKPFRGLPWRNGPDLWIAYTSVLQESDLVRDDVLRSCPGIYQAIVAKDFEVRATMMGRHCFAAKILSQQTATGRVDWRRSYHELKMEPFTLPSELVSACHDLMERLGIVFGCFDFIVNTAGEFVFLEVNEMGQFLFVERYAGLPLLDAFSELLLQGRFDFDWRSDGDHILYADVEAAALAAEKEANETHVPAPDSALWEEAEVEP